MAGHIHIVKLCVGAESVEDLETWQAGRADPSRPMHVTRMWPKRADEVLNGGSLYWVIKGLILARQRIVALEECTGRNGLPGGCGIVFDPAVIRTEAVPKRPFQGWRYLRPEDAPRDLPKARGNEGPLPNDLASALAEIGLR
jgi:hypothetical protein